MENEHVKRMLEDIIGWAERSFVIGGIAIYKQRDLKERIERGLGQALNVTHPVKHLRKCGNWVDGDKVFMINKTYQKDEPGERFNCCPICWPTQPKS